MSFRSSQIAVQGETIQRLRLAIELYPSETHINRDSWNRSVSIDELADHGLNEWIKEKFPKVLELEKKLNKVKSDAIKEANATQ